MPVSLGCSMARGGCARAVIHRSQVLLPELVMAQTIPSSSVPHVGPSHHPCKVTVVAARHVLGPQSKIQRFYVRIRGRVVSLTKIWVLC